MMTSFPNTHLAERQPIEKKFHDEEALPSRTGLDFSTTSESFAAPMLMPGAFSKSYEGNLLWIMAVEPVPLQSRMLAKVRGSSASISLPVC